MSSRRRIILLLVAIAVVMLALLAVFGRAPEEVLLPSSSAYSVSGEMSGEVMLPQEASVDGTLSLWALGREQSRGRAVPSTMSAGHSGGDLISLPFAAPGVLGLFLSGDYKGVDNRLFVKLEGTRHWRELYVSHSSDDWILFRWPLPADWEGRKVRVIARLGEMTPGVWVGVSAPVSCSWLSTFAQQLASHAMLPIFLLHFILFLLPGLLISYYLKLHLRLGEAYTLITGVGLSALLGYCAFWAYFAQQQYGVIFSVAILSAAAIVFAASLLRRDFRDFLLGVDVAVPTLLMLLVGVLYIALLLSMGSTSSAHDLARGRFITVVHGDNAFPMIFSEGLYRGLKLGPVRLGNFLSSDRPPLQAGLLLMQRPLMGIIPGFKEFQYQVLGTVAQVSWVPAVWTICRLARLPLPRLALVFCFCTFSGFFLFNSVHVWPKMLAGALTVLAVCCVLERPRADQRHSYSRLLVIGGAVALGLLSHGGSVFPSLLLLALLVLPGRFPGLGRVLAGIAVFACLMGPWVAYQKLYDPPGNRLVKWHLGGVKNTDDRSSLAAITEAYRSISPQEVVQHKLANFSALVWQEGDRVDGYGFIDRGDISMASVLRSQEFLHVFWALGLLNLGWLLLAASLKVARLRRKGFAWARGSLVFSLCALLLWTLAMFGPGTTHIFQGSHATMILLFTGLAMMVTSVHRLLSYLLVAAGAALFAWVWVFTTPPRPPSDILAVPDLTMIGLAALALAALVALLVKVSRLSPP